MTEGLRKLLKEGKCEMVKEDCSRISKIIATCVKHANTKIQIHKTTYLTISDMQS